ncbi:MAG: VCBS repeat-containing protein [Phycisphaerae bacterium]|nr:VCBS repeat-containing protein [Phycisphaerae bacterium]
MKPVLVFFISSILILTTCSLSSAQPWFNLSKEEIVQAVDSDIITNGYSVPSTADWNNDGQIDLIVGEGSGGYAGKVRIYLNSGTTAAPLFTHWFYAQVKDPGGATSDLQCTSSGCLGCFPRVVYWNDDHRKDLLIGEALGKIKIFINNSTDPDDTNPTFDSGTYLTVGPPGNKSDISVGSRATPSLVDWNNDGKRDLVSGDLSGKISLFLNAGTDDAPDYPSQHYAQANSTPLIITGGRSSPVIGDLNNDGKKDILSGNTNGQLLLYANIGTDAAPAFAGYTAMTANGIEIDLPGSPRSRPFVCDWTNDGYLDVVIGAYGGKVYLYQGIRIPGDLDSDHTVNINDFALFAHQWQTTTPCTPDNNWCNWSDIDHSSQVTFTDLHQFVISWLK